MINRTIGEVRTAHPSRDGDGVAIQRISGMRHAGMDPILLLDELSAERREDFAGGFPPHPHRGMQTLTYMKHGGIIHQDNRGNRGEIRGGGAQWMSAGRGIVHSEMPTQDSTGLHGFQLWVNLPAAEKMSEPGYRDIPAEALARLERQGFTAVAVAGEWQLQASEGTTTETLTGPLEELAPRAAVLDLVLQAGASVSVNTARPENLLAYVYRGSLAAQDITVSAQQMAVTRAGDRFTITAGADGAELLLLRGEPLAEPVANYGPFVMNTAEEIEQAMADYRDGKFV